MKIIDTQKREYTLNETFIVQTGEFLPYLVLRSELKQAVLGYLDRVTPHFLSSNKVPWAFPAPAWIIELTFFGRLHIGCRMFNRKNTKIIIEWAKGAR